MFKYLYSSKEEFLKGIKNLHVMYEKLTVFQFSKQKNQHVYKEKGEFTQGKYKHRLSAPALSPRELDDEAPHMGCLPSALPETKLCQLK